MNEPTEEDRQNWTKLTQSFAKDTTFHGIRYIAEETPYQSRRLSWIAVVLTVSAVFTTLVVVRLQVFYSHPVLVNLDTDYRPSLPFPVVTICNQNRYSKTALQRNGLLDVIANTYHRHWWKSKRRNKSNLTGDAFTDCQDSYVLKPDLCEGLYNLWYLDKYNETTEGVCRTLCSSATDDICSGIFYDHVDRSCRLLRSDVSDHLDSVQQKAKCESRIHGGSCCRSYYYKRKRCIDVERIYYDFEKSDNGLLMDETYGAHWQRIKAIDAVTESMRQDHTFNSELGHFMYLVKMYTGRSFKAAMHTRFINTTNKCLHLFCKFTGNAALKINIIPGSSSTNLHSDRNVSSRWLHALIKLPHGIRRIQLVGDPGDDGDYNSIAVDDFLLSSCDTNNTGSSALEHADYAFRCDDGQYIPRESLCNGIDDCANGQDEILYCGDLQTAQCDFSHPYACGYRQVSEIHEAEWRREVDDKYHLHYNSLVTSRSTLGCSAMAFRCLTNARCIPRSLICDGRDDCGDNSDETALCDCSSDLLFIVDESGSICDESFFNGVCDNWRKMQQFLVNIVLKMSRSASDTRIAMITFSNSAHIEFLLNECTKKEALQFIVNRSYSFGGVTNTASAFDLALQKVFTLRNGDRPNADNIAILLTDGRSTRNTNRTIPSAERMRQANIRIISVGVTTMINEIELKMISSYPHKLNQDYFTALDFDQLGSLLDKISTSACIKPTTPQPVDSGMMYSMKLVTTANNSLPGEHSVLRSPLQYAEDSTINELARVLPAGIVHQAYTKENGVQLTYSVALSRRTNDLLSSLDVYIVRPTYNQQPSELSHLFKVGTWTPAGNSSLSVQQTVCVPTGNYWLELHATRGWAPAVYQLNRVHGGNNWAIPCQPRQVLLANGSTVSCNFNSADLCSYQVRTQTEFATWTRIPKQFVLDLPKNIEVCNMTFHSVTGRIVSSNLLPTQTTDVNCSWRIQAPKGSQISLQFENVDGITKITYNNYTRRQLTTGQILLNATDVTIHYTTGGVLSVVYNIIAHTRLDYAIVSSYHGLLLNKTYSTKLISPVYTITQQHCLTVKLVLHGQLKITAYIFNRENVLYDGHIDLGQAWHLLSFHIDNLKSDVPFQVVFDSVFDAGQIENSAIVDEITLIEGPCEENVTIVPEVLCTFDDMLQCGYLDVSEGPSKWLRHYDIQNSDYSMLASFHNTSSTARLLSPQSKNDGEFCFTFHMFVGSAQRLAVSIGIQEFVPENASLLMLSNSDVGFWKVINVSVVMTTGSRLYIEATGSNTDWLKVDDVNLFNSSCTKIGRKPSELTTVAGNSTSREKPIPVLIDQKNVMSSGNDSANNTRLSANRNDAANDYLIDELPSLDVAVSQFIRMNSPDISNFILDCTLHGAPCPLDYIKSEITDMGYCVSLKSSPVHNVTINATGPNNGLTLVLNSQIYEQIQGLQVDTGIKVHLYDEKEIASMTDKGISLSPGAHTSLSMDYTTSTILEKPYGNCGKEKLSKFVDDEYRFSKCQLEVATFTMENTCGCKDAHMPGSTRICSMAEYLRCVILGQNFNGSLTSRPIKANCPTDCISADYRSRLSHAPLSDTIIDTLSTHQRHQLLSAYRNAININHRTAERLMLTHAKHFSGLKKAVYGVELFMNFNIQASAFRPLTRALDSIIQMANHDISYSLFSTVHELQVAYDRFLAPANNIISALLNQQKQKVEEILFAIWRFDDAVSMSKDVEVLVSVTRAVISALDKVDFIQIRNATDLECCHDRIAIVVSRDSHVCQRAVYKWKTSSESLLQYTDHLVNVTLIEWYVKQSNCETDEKCPERTYWQSTLEKLRALWFSDVTTFNALHNCIESFRQLLADIRNAENVRKHADLVLAADSSFTKTNMWNIFNELRLSPLLSDELQHQYINNSIDIVAIMQLFSDDTHMTFVRNSLRRIQTEVQLEILEPLQRRLLEAQTRLSTNYRDAFKLFHDLSLYTGISTDMKITAMSIWRRPIFKFSAIRMQSRHDNYLPSYKLKDFILKTASDKATHILDVYFNSLISNLYDVNEEMILLTEKIVIHLEKYRQFLSTNISKHVYLDEDFVRKNLIQIDVFYGDLKYTGVQQERAYTITNFFSDMGGYMGLLLGASIVTICEVVDFLVYNLFLRRHNNKCTEDSKRKRHVFSDDSKNESTELAHV